MTSWWAIGLRLTEGLGCVEVVGLTKSESLAKGLRLVHITSRLRDSWLCHLSVLLWYIKTIRLGLIRVETIVLHSLIIGWGGYVCLYSLRG